MIFYISGKITGLPLTEAKRIFSEAEQRLTAEGHSVISPLKLSHLGAEEWTDYMRTDIAALTTCDAIYMLDCWKDSKSAVVEEELAKVLGLDRIYETPKMHPVHEPNKFMVFPRKDVGKYLYAHERETLLTLYEVMLRKRCKNTKLVAKSFYCCNTDEPYSDLVLKVILEGEMK